MTVTYKPLKMFPEILTPVLHKVMYDVSAEDYQLNTWLKENCKGYYYHSPGWMKEKFIQFEDDHDALLFSLRWT
jgi:hypothetical protein